MGKGTEVIAQLRKHILTKQEAQERRYGVIPGLQLRPDSSLEASDLPALADALGSLSSGEVRNILITDPENNRSAVVVPTERYVGLVAIELATGNFSALPDGRLEPTDLADSEVEQLNPEEFWGREPI